MKKLSLLSILLLFLAGLLHAQTPNNAPKPTYKANQVLLKLSSGVDKWQQEATILDILAAQAGKITPIYGTDVQLVYLPDVVVIDGQSLHNPQQIADYFSRHPHPYLDYIEPNYLYNIATTPNDPHFDDQWGLQQANDRDIDAPEAWDMNHDCNDVVVGLLDSGIDWRHPDLIDNIWQNLGEDADNDGHVLELISGVWQFDPGDINNTDNDGNGYKDDFIGWDFANNDNNPMDDNGHGTHCGGIIGARGNNGIGITGVCWSVKIMALKFLGSDGGGATSDATAALNYAVAKQATLTNNSWGGASSSVALQNAIANAQTHNQLFITSSGNDSKNIDTAPFYPANYSSDNIIVVAASTPSDNLAGFSNYGQANVDVLAPGVDIYSTQPNNTYGYESGTSQATAFVTGAAALVYCNNATYTNLKNTLLNSIDTKPILTFKCTTGGRINAFKARANANCCTATANFTASASTNCTGNLISFTNTSTNASTYQWTIDDTIQPYNNTISYNFTTGGEHTIALLASNGTCTDAAYQTLNITDPLAVNFTHFKNGLIIACFVPASNNTYQWNFGDGATSTNNNAVHNYTTAGTYNVCLTASNECDTLQTCQSITVNIATDCSNSIPGIEWQNTIGGGNNDALQSIQQTTDGGYILGGSSNSDISGDKTQANKGDYDYWIVKLNTEGQIQTQRTIGGSGNDYLQSIQQTADGGYILGGYSNSGISGDKTEPNQGGGYLSPYYDYWVVKLSANGTIQWQNTIGGSGNDYLQSIQQTTDGGYILGGHSDSGISGDKTEANQGSFGSDYWVVKLSSTGITQWQNTIGGSSGEDLQSIQQTTDGGYILGGHSWSGISGDKTEVNQGEYDYWVVKLTTTGTIQWQNTIGGSSSDYLQSIQQTIDGGYILGGYSESGISGDKTEASQGGYDYWMVKLSATGTIQWQNTIGGSSTDYLQSIQQTTDGGYILGGRSNSGISGDKTEASLNDDYWVVKLAATGTIEWQNTIGGGSSDDLKSIQQTTDGGYILGGSSYSGISGDKTEANLNNQYTTQYTSDYWVVKIQAAQNSNPLSAAFEAPSFYCSNTPILLHNTSTLATAYQWNINGAPISNNTDLSHTFNTAGEQTVTLIASNGICSDTLSKTIYPSSTTINFVSNLNALTATFIASSGASSYTWNFGDGTTATGFNTQHTYAVTGTYNVCLTTNTNCGNSTICKNVTVSTIPTCVNDIVEWQNTIGGNSSDDLQSIQQTTDGGYILGGYSYSGISGDKIEASQGNYDYWVVKLTTTGTIEWQNTIGGSDDDRLQSVQQTMDGGYILGGYSYSGISGDKTEASQGYRDYWVVKLSATGTIEWQNTIGGSNDDILQSIQQTTDGGYILGGYSASGISGDKTEASQGSDYWVVKLSATGTIGWQNTIGGSGNNDELQSIQQTTDGGYILGGYSASGISGDKTEASQGSNDYWVVKLTATGTIEWQNTIGGGSTDELQSIQQTTDGGYILGGHSNSGISGDKTEASQGSNDYWVVKLSATGTIEWQNTIGGNDYDLLQSIQQTTDGGYILGGYSNSGISGDKTESGGGYWVIKLSTTGTIEWQNTINGGSSLQSIQQTTDGGYILGGSSSSGISIDKTEASQGGSDYWVIKLPSIKFILSESTICKDIPTVFVNTNNDADSYVWEVDDIPVSTSINLNYAFTTAGSHTITLIARYGDCIIKSNQSIVVIDVPIQDFTYTKNSLTVNFLAETGASNYVWNYGDGNTAIGQNTNHTYANSGTYTACLSVNYTCGSNNTCYTITIDNTPNCTKNAAIEWQNTIGGSTYDYLQSVQQTTDGGYILGGYSNSGISGDKTEASQGGNDYWVVKLTATDTVEWQNTIGGNSVDELQSIQQTTDGGYILGGYSASDISGDKTEANQGSSLYYDYWVVKLSTTGTIEWQNTIGGSADDKLQSIQQTTDGGYILGGYSKSGISGDKTEANQGSYYDYWVVKLTTTGTIEWQNTIGGSSNDYLQSIQQTTDGGYILGGYSGSGISGDKTEANQGSYYDYWVVKLTTTGTIEWQNTIGGSSEDYLQSIQQTTDGGYILGGYSNSGISGDKTEANQGSYFDYWVVKLSATGTIEWQNTIGGSSGEQLQSVQQTTDGGYILGGYSASGISGDKTEATKGGNDYWVVKLSAAGTIEWQNAIGGNGVDYLQSIQQTTDGGYILGGYSASGISGDKTEANQANPGYSYYYDYWVVKITDITPATAYFTIPANTNPITFTNISTYAISYEWQVDGVPISTSTNLTYTFPTGGTHTITLVASNGECVDTYSQTINVLANAVWPGDANADGTVNMLDYLALGIAYNHVDIPRLEQNIDWNAKFATNFNQTFGGNLFANTNYKHTDCNGNGTINFADTTAILQNFGLSYLPATTLAPSVSPQALVSIEANTPYVAASAVAFLNIKLQNALDNNNPVNLYGMAFSIDYTGASNPQLDFTGSCLGTLGTDFIASYKIDDANKKIHVGITRFNHNNSLALGTVATLQLNINALPTGTALAIGAENIVLCDNEGYRIPAAAGVAANMQVQTSASPVMLQAKALLQCSITDLNVGNALMTTEFNSTLPTQQPFNAAPWNYTGTESGTIPANAVDWVLVELRNSANINQVIARKAVLLLNDGSLQDVGTPLQNNRVAFVGLASNQSYFVVLRHHSHQTIASSVAVPVSNNLMSIDFTQSADQTNGGAASLAYINGWYALKLVLTPTLSGNTTVCSGTTQTYTNSTPVSGVTYTWSATGGSIVSGQGGNSVQIQWANGTSGTVTLTAEEHLCSEVASASITVSLTPDAIITVGGTAAGGGTPGLTSYNLCPTCKVYLKSNYTNLTNYTLKWYKNNNELTQYQNYLGGYVKKAGNYKLKVIRNSTGCEDFSQTVTVTGGAPMLTDNNNPNINNTPSMGKEEELLFESENLELFVYPNPAQNRVTIAYNIADNNQLSLKIYDIMGQLQHAQTLAISNNTLDVDVSTYPSGTYLVQLLGDKGSVVSYLMVVK